MIKTRSKVTAFVVTLFMGVVVALSATTTAQATPVVSGPDSNGVCHTTSEVTQYEYSKFVPGHAETTHNEYKYNQVTTVYTVEHKQITIPASGSDRTSLLTWLGTIGATDNGNNKWQLPDALVNAAGVHVVGPGAVAPSGNVSMIVYGGPNITVHYEITSIDITTNTPPSGLYVTNHNVTLYYTGSGNGSTNSSDAVYTATNPGSPWVQFGTVKVVGNGDGVSDVTNYYLPGGGQDTTTPNADTTADDAHWTTDTMPDGWTLYAQRQSTVSTVVTCPPAAPITCTVVGPSYTEDVLPTPTADGDLYTGQTSPVERYYPVTGNLQGLGVQTVTFAQVAGYQPSFTIVFDPNGVVPTTLGGDGTTVKHYANLVAEWYMNGGSPSTDGTFTINPATTLFWTNKIDQDKAGGQNHPQLLSYFVSLWPNNTFTPGTGAGAIGGHLGSGQTDATHSVVTAMTGCANVSNVWPSVTFPTANTTPATCMNDAQAHEFSYTIPDAVANTKYVLIDGVRPVGGTYFLNAGETAGPFVLHTLASAQVQQGSVTFGPFTGTGETDVQYTDSGAPCYVAPTVVEPVGPTVTNGTCVAKAPVDGSATTFAELVAMQEEGVVTTLNTDSTTDGTFSAATGFVLKDGALTTFHLGTPVNKTAAECNPPTVLAYTGENWPWLMTILALVVLGFGIAARSFAYRSRKLLGL